jgi:hypothetical protein
MASNGNGRQARTANDVAQLESDYEYLYNENIRLERELAVITADRTRLQVENALLEGKSMQNLVKATRMETIVRNVSAGLVQALQALNDERSIERTVKRQVQEQQLEDETGPAPAFLRQPPPPPLVRTESDEDRVDRLRGAAERLARSPVPVATTRPGQIDHTIAAHDSRLPRMDYGRDVIDEEADRANLAGLAGNMETQTK